ncbi:hypothetical protein SDC9_204314 [bioreactor metagenome]|uniref:Uncharacterized protein n=1 Tax=bioreactor metagenome TaxID=1076179 RepID=A0A645J834_9ZZZZ
MGVALINLTGGAVFKGENNILRQVVIPAIFAENLKLLGAADTDSLCPGDRELYRWTGHIAYDGKNHHGCRSQAEEKGAKW